MYFNITLILIVLYFVNCIHITTNKVIQNFKQLRLEKHQLFTSVFTFSL